MKESFYFPHDYNARSDEKVLKLRRTCGLEGYGIYWCLIESLANSSEARLPLSSLEDIAFELQTKYERITEIVNNFGLFEHNSTHFWSKRLCEHFKNVTHKSFMAKKSVMKRWANIKQNNKGTNVLPTQCDSNTIKERKREEKIRKENKEIYSQLGNVKLFKKEYEELKNRFPTDLEERIENLSLYIASKGDKYKSRYATILSWAKKEPITKQPCQKQEHLSARATRL